MADLYGTYDKRIKLTIDHNDIDSELTWFPVTVFFTSTQGEEIFTEFDADEDFDRCAFTTSDGSTQLYADCELFDASEQKAIYHVSKTGWTISDSSDTDFYFYYDNDAGHNTTYISKSGNTAAQSVWDSNFKAVYHMNDPEEPTYDTEYDGSVEPDSDGWTLGGTDYASSDGDILTIDTTADGSYTCYYYKAPDVNFDNGFYLKIRTQIHDDTNADAYQYIRINDGTQNEWCALAIAKTILYDAKSGGFSSIKVVDTTDTYHIYEIYIKGSTAKVYMDGAYVDTITIVSDTVSDNVQFGDVSTGATSKLECMIDYVNYALDIGYNPYGIVDATSNANHGDKKASGEPAEATGKVGKGQTYDATDDYITVADDDSLDFGTGDFTLEAIIKTDTQNNRIFNKGNYGEADGMYRIYFRDSDPYIRMSVYNNSAGTQSDDEPTDYADGYFHHIVGQRDGDYLRIFGDGAEKGTAKSGADDVDVSSNNSLYLGAESSVATFTVKTLDEMRISSSARSAAWIAATYDSLWDTLLTYGDEETSEATVDNAIFFGMNF